MFVSQKRTQAAALNPCNILIFPGQIGRHFADDIFKPTFVNENFRLFNKISQNFVPKVPSYNNPAFV